MVQHGSTMLDVVVVVVVDDDEMLKVPFHKICNCRHHHNHLCIAFFFCVAEKLVVVKMMIDVYYVVVWLVVMMWIELLLLGDHYGCDHDWEKMTMGRMEKMKRSEKLGEECFVFVVVVDHCRCHHCPHYWCHDAIEMVVVVVRSHVRHEQMWGCWARSFLSFVSSRGFFCVLGFSDQEKTSAKWLKTIWLELGSSFPWS